LEKTASMRSGLSMFASYLSIAQSSTKTLPIDGFQADEVLQISNGPAAALFADGVALICDRTTASSRRQGKVLAGEG
jgi:hypothetical protein